MRVTRVQWSSRGFPGGVGREHRLIGWGDVAQPNHALRQTLE